MDKWISYAQNFEDVLLRRVFPESTDGFYLDAGANHPVYHSVTKHFYDRGWRGVNIEPMASVAAELVAGRPRDLTLAAGLSDREGQLTFYEAPPIPQLTTDPDVLTGWFGARREDLIEHKVPVTTLAHVCEQYVGDRTIDFLKVDVEGHELEVLRGADWSRWRPRVLLIEGEREPWEPLLLAADYVFATFDGVNQYYLRAEDGDLLPRLRYPVYVLDNFVQYDQIKPYEGLPEALDALRAEYEAGRAASVEALKAARAALDELRAEGEALRARLAPVEGLGPVAIDLAHRLRRASRRFPRIAAMARRTLHRAG